MKRLAIALFALAALAACKDKTPTVREDAGTITFDASTSKYRYWNQNDYLARFMVVVPMTFAKSEVRTCNVTECLAELIFTGDGITIRAYAPPASGERHSLDEDKAAAARNKETVTSDTSFPGGWSFTTLSADGRTYGFTHQVGCFVSPVRVEIRGPIAQKADIDEIAERLVKELLVSTRKPAHYCNDLPWSPPSARKQAQTWLGTLSVAADVKGKPEEPYILTLDEPVCAPNGRAVWELEVKSSGKTPLSAYVGQHVTAKGTFDAAGPQDYRPIVSPLELVTVDARDP